MLAAVHRIYPQKRPMFGRNVFAGLGWRWRAVPVRVGRAVAVFQDHGKGWTDCSAIEMRLARQDVVVAAEGVQGRVVEAGGIAVVQRQYGHFHRCLCARARRRVFDPAPRGPWSLDNRTSDGLRPPASGLACSAAGLRRAGFGG
ncbi:MAG: hypothetical protein FJ100_22000 [Deltaproteobacteria bacterium]|nr:hypothetical protein [Deltaproteobacteria bacterium]